MCVIHAGGAQGLGLSFIVFFAALIITGMAQ